MRVLHFAISTPNLASQIAFLALEAHGPIFISADVRPGPPQATPLSSNVDARTAAKMFSHATAGCENDR